MLVSLVFQFVYTVDSLNSSDPTFDIWRAAIPGQISQALSIMTASTVYLKPFVDSLQSGFLQAGDLRRRQGSEYGYGAGQGTQEGSAIRFKRRLRWSSKRDYPTHVSQYSDIELQMPRPARTSDVRYSATARPAEPLSNLADSEQFIIQTTTWAVETAQS